MTTEAIETAVRQVLNRWSDAFACADVDAIADLYATDAVFIGTTSRRFEGSPEAVRAHFETVMTARTPLRAEALETHIAVPSANVAVATVLDRIEWVGPPTSQVSFGRVTLVLAPRSDRWRIVHFHRSAVPADAS